MMSRSSQKNAESDLFIYITSWIHHVTSMKPHPLTISSLLSNFIAYTWLLWWHLTWDLKILSNYTKIQFKFTQEGKIGQSIGTIIGDGTIRHVTTHKLQFMEWLWRLKAPAPVAGVRGLTGKYHNDALLLISSLLMHNGIRKASQAL